MWWHWNERMQWWELYSGYDFPLLIEVRNRNGRLVD